MTKSDQVILEVSVRELIGGKLGSLRKTGMVPANITGMAQDSKTIMLPTRVFLKHIEQEGESGLLYLQVEGQKSTEPVLIEEIQYAPVDGSILHVVFRRVNLKEKVTAEVPVETIGEFAVRGANMMVVTDSFEVEALPADLPESFVFDVSKLTEVGQVLTIEDLEYDREKITIILSDEEKENPIIMAQEQREEEVAETSEVESEAAEGAEDAASSESDIAKSTDE
jgi:large subunit ribosomal protein L25